MADEAEIDEEIEQQLEVEARNNICDDEAFKMDDDVSFSFSLQKIQVVKIIVLYSFFSLRMRI